MSAEEFWSETKGEYKPAMRPIVLAFCEFAEAYAAHERGRMLNVSEDEVFNISKKKAKELKHDYHSAHELIDIGAKALLNHLKKKNK